MATKTVFVIRNHLHQYLNKQSNWISGKEALQLYRSDFHDEALNTLIEVNAKDVSLRGIIIEVEVNDKKRPQIEIFDSAVALENNES